MTQLSKFLDREHRVMGLWIIFALILISTLLYVRKNIRPERADAIDPEIIYYSSTSTGTISLNATPSTETMVKAIPDFVTVPKDGIAWEPFAETKSIPYEEKDEDGMDVQGVRPDFSDEIKALDGQTIIMQGYIFPLDPGEEQKLFLFGPFPVGCPYHYHVGPALVMEAHAKETLKFGYEPVNIEGRLELVPHDDEYNVFYRLYDVILKE